MTRRVAAVLLLCLPVVPAVAAGDSPRAALVVLQPTGEERNGLPVMIRHPNGADYGRQLTVGFPARMLRLYAMEQEYLRQRTGAVPEPAYLSLGTQQGGFPRFGLVFEGREQPKAGWVDLHQSQRVTGYFGAIDQIFPHELLHVITRQLAGEPRESGANQVHAIGVRTDPVIAFQEGFAESVQILSLDDPGALPETAALASDASLAERAGRELQAFGRELTARLPIVEPSRLRTLLWFSSTEQVLRYHQVKANAFAREPMVPDALLSGTDRYREYLYRSVMPGDARGRLKTSREMLSTEGVVSHLFWRWATDGALQRIRRDDAFYASFGTSAAAITPVENVFLKIFHALYVGRPSDTAGLLRAYVGAFPDEAADLNRVVTAALAGQSVGEGLELWLCNDGLQTGTSLFDQFRGLPRPHTFDANAASPFDWRTVEGVTPEVAERLVAGAPYHSLDELLGKAGNTALVTRIRSLAQAMDELRRKSHDQESSLSIQALAMPYVWRALGALAAASLMGAWLARQAGLRRWWSSALCGAVASVMVLGLSWMVVAPWWIPVVAPILAGGVPCAAAVAARRRTWRAALWVLAAWAAASAPAIALSRTWF
jgi:hypothetical protein